MNEELDINDVASAFKSGIEQGIQAGFEISKQAMSTAIIDTCRKQWWHRIYPCNCRGISKIISSVTPAFKFKIDTEIHPVEEELPIGEVILGE